MPETQDRVQRRIVFYRLRVLRLREAPDDSFGQDAWSEISNLSVPERVLDVGYEGRLMVSWPHEAGRFPALRFGSVRTTAFPEVFRQADGDTHDLDLEDDEGLVDSMHLVFLPKGVIGAEFNQLAPRVTQLPNYLRQVLPDLEPHVRAKVLLRPEVLEQLRQLQGLTVAEIEISRSNLDLIEQADDPDGSIFRSLRANSEQFGGDQIRIIVKHGGRRGQRRQGLLQTGVDAIRRLASREDFIEAASTFRVQGFSAEDNAQLKLDLLNEKIVSETTVARVGKNRVVSSSEMLGKIVDAYYEREEEIGRSAEAAFQDG